MSLFGKSRRAQDAHYDEIEKTLDARHDALRAQEPRVNALVAWLTERKLNNGFGEDFEWTLANPRRSGG